MYSLIISFIVANCVLTVFNTDIDGDVDVCSRFFAMNSTNKLH